MSAQNHWFQWGSAIILACSVATNSRAIEAIKNSECLECHSDKTLTKTNENGATISLFVDEVRFKGSAHGTNSCVSCHSDLTTKHPDDNLAAKPVACSKCHEKQSESYNASVHGLACKTGKPGSATCVDCHDTHEVLPPSSPQSPLHFSNLAKTCGECHEEAGRDVAVSVHGKAVAKGSRDAATCTDCHSEHKIEKLKDGSSQKISGEVCGRCHASERLNTKYNMPKDRVKTFFESYHGLAGQYGSTTAANCGSCHGFHKILASTDPNSTIHPAHLAETCRKCHPGTSEKFSQSRVHVDATTAAAGDVGGQINAGVRTIYLWLIAVVIGGMCLHNGLLFWRKARARYRAAPRQIERMTVSQRIQHAVLVFSFLVLAITGFALKFPESWVARAMGSNEAFRSWSHRVAGIILLGICAYHVVYLMMTTTGRKLVRDFLPQKKDINDVICNCLYLVGIRIEKPKFARFGYAEKAEYWALVWGTIIMGGTGLMLWFKTGVTNYIPRWALDVATTIHYYEAILACLAIVVWHFYHVIFDPDVYPANLACLDGKVSEHWQAEEHPLEQLPGSHAPTDHRAHDEPRPQFDFTI